MLATMHQKDLIMKPLLEKHFGVRVEVPTNFNTDRFGTFSGEVERVGSQLEAARAKARAALEFTGADLVIASEGSFSPHPNLPLLTQQIEMVILIDDQQQHEVVGRFVSVGRLAKRQTAKSPAEVVEIATGWGFPTQGVILKTHPPRKIIVKNCTDEASLLKTAESLLGRFLVRNITVETDLRAHRCPGRWELIAKATENLIETYHSRCPQCKAPGYSLKESQPGLPCATCGLPTDQIKSELYQCAYCGYGETKTVSAVAADPGECTWCNP